MSDMEITNITIRRILTEEGADNVTVEASDQNNELPGLIEMLGMLDLARDTVFKMAMGEVDEDEDSEDDEDVR